MSSGSASAAVISVFSDKAEVSVGEKFNVSFALSYLTNAEALVGFDIDVLFSSNLLTLAGFSIEDPTIGNPFDSTNSSNFISANTQSTGVLDFAVTSFDDDADLITFQPSSFVFFTMELIANLASATPAKVSLDINDNLLLFLGTDLSDLPVQFATTQIEVLISNNPVIGVNSPPPLILMALVVPFLLGRRMSPLAIKKQSGA